MRARTTFQVFIWSSIFGAFFGIIASQLMLNYYFNEFDIEDGFRNFYDEETSVLISPHSLRKTIEKGEGYTYNIVDLRLISEYESGHIIGAVNVPVALTLSQKMDMGFVEISDEDRIVNAFRNITSNGRDTVVYCYSASCMVSRNVGEVLAKNRIYVNILSVGWSEWKYDWKNWNYEREWNSTNVNDYISYGSLPGEFDFNAFEFGESQSKITCAIENELSC